MTQLTLEDTLEDHNDTVNIGGRTGRPFVTSNKVGVDHWPAFHCTAETVASTA